MPTTWPPTEPFDDRKPWHQVLPTQARDGFEAAVVIGGLGHADMMASLWCRTVLDDAHIYYQAARHASWANWAIERMEDWSPTETEFQRCVQELWTVGCRLLVSAHLAQQWVIRADPTVEEIDGLRTARNSIEHLSEATFNEDHTTATSTGPRDKKGRAKRAWSIDDLPEGKLLLGLGRTPLTRVFDAVDLEAIVTFADAHAWRDSGLELADSAYLLLTPPE